MNSKQRRKDKRKTARAGIWYQIRNTKNKPTYKESNISLKDLEDMIIELRDNSRRTYQQNIEQRININKTLPKFFNERK